MKKVLYGEGFKSNNALFEIGEMTYSKNSIWAMPILEEEDIFFQAELYKKAGYEIIMAAQDEDYYFMAVNVNLNETDDDSAKIDGLSKSVAKEIAVKRFYEFGKTNAKPLKMINGEYFEKLVAENNRIEEKINNNIFDIKQIDLEYLELIKNSLLKQAMHKLGYKSTCRTWKKQ